MTLYALGDLHLSETVDKPMDVFGPVWMDHTQKMKDGWQRIVGEADTVLIPGDISWAMSLDEAQADLAWIAALPGKKVLIRGNHDYWWSAIGRVRQALSPQMFALQNDAIVCEASVVCGTRGWLLPTHPKFTAHDETIYRREGERLRLALTEAQKANLPIIVMLHYPPLSVGMETSVFTELLEQFGVHLCIYGHLHGAAHRFAVEGVRNGVEYRLVSADYVNFQPVPLHLA